MASEVIKAMELNETRKVEVFWAARLDEAYPEHSVMISRKGEIEYFPNRLRLKIYNPGEWDEPTQLILYGEKGKWFYKCDCYDDAEKAYELKRFDADTTIVFFIHDGFEALHIHCMK